VLTAFVHLLLLSVCCLQVQQWLADFRAAGSSAEVDADIAALHTWDVEWVELKLQLFYIQQDRVTDLPGISVTFADKTFGAAAAKLDSLERRPAALTRKHVPFGTTMPEVRALGPSMGCG
jgi:hypothetical protein